MAPWFALLSVVITIVSLKTLSTPLFNYFRSAQQFKFTTYTIVFRNYSNCNTILYLVDLGNIYFGVPCTQKKGF